MHTVICRCDCICSLSVGLFGVSATGVGVSKKETSGTSNSFAHKSIFYADVWFGDVD